MIFPEFEEIHIIDGMNLQLSPFEFDNEYDNKLTTTKWLLKIEEKINDTIKNINSIIKKSINYTDQEIKKIDLEHKKLLENEVIKLEKIISNIKQELITYNDSTNESLKNAIIQLYTNADNTLKRIIEEDYNSKIFILDSREQKHYEELIKMCDFSDFLVVNPTNGKRDSITKVLNDLYDFMRNCYTVGEIDAKELSVSRLDEILSNNILQIIDRDTKNLF